MDCVLSFRVGLTAWTVVKSTVLLFEIVLCGFDVWFIVLIGTCGRTF